MKKLIYLLVGDELEEMQEYVNKVKLKENISSDNYFSFNEENNYQEVLLELNSFSLFDELKLVVYKTDSITNLLDYIKNPNENAILIIMISKVVNKLDYEYLEKVEFQKPTEKNLGKYIKKIVTSKQKSITEEAINELIKRTNQDYLSIKIELEKLLIYCSDSIEQIDLSLIENLVPINLEDNVFEIIEAILNRNKKQVWLIYQDLLKKNQDSIQILNVLQNKFNEIYYTRIMLDAKKSNDEIKDYFNYSKGRTYYTIKAANSFDLSSIKYFIKSLSDLEYKVKSGQVEKNLALELFILELR